MQMKQNRIRELRNAKDVTQEELRERMYALGADLTAAAISRHENHQRAIDPITAKIYTEALGSSCWKRR